MPVRAREAAIAEYDIKNFLARLEGIYLERCRRTRATGYAGSTNE